MPDVTSSAISVEASWRVHMATSSMSPVQSSVVPAPRPTVMSEPLVPTHLTYECTSVPS